MQRVGDMLHSLIPTRSTVTTVRRFLLIGTTGEPLDLPLMMNTTGGETK